MKGKSYLSLAILFALLAVLAWLWPIDRTPPQVQIQPVPGKYHEVISVVLSSEPGASVFIALDDGQPMPYLSPVRIKRDTRVGYFAEDRFGNRSTVQSASYAVRLDTEPPVTTALPSGGKFFHPVSVRLKSEEGAVISYTTDGTEPGPGSSTYTSPVAMRRDTTLRFFATDEAGNREEARKETYLITLDSTKPVTLAEPSGGLFNSPVTVSLSGEEGTTIHFTINGSRPSTGSPRYSGPLQFVRSGVLRFFAIDEAGNREDVREENYVIDSQPPTVIAKPPAGAFGKPTVVTLTSSERGQIHYEMDGREATLSSPVYRSPLRLAADTVVSFMAVDAAGNRSPVVTAQYVIDTQPPTVQPRPPGGDYSGRIRVKIEASEPAEIFYTLDGTTPSDRSSPYQGPITIEKNTVLTYLAVDRVGNRSQPRSQEYVLDSTPPDTAAQPPGGTFSGEVTVSLVGEEGAVIRYTTDGISPTEASPRYRGPVRITKDTVLKFYGTDDSGNREEIQVERYSFDTTPPSTRIEPDPGYFNRPVSVTLVSEKQGTIFVRRAGVNDFTAYAGPFVVDRTEKLSYYSVDSAGNKEPAQVAEYFIDTIAPFTLPFPAPGEYNPPIILELKSEEGARIRYTLDGSQPSDQAPAYTKPLSLNDDITVKYFAVDKAGNREKVKTAAYRLSSGIWRDNSNGVFIHPSVIQGDYLWVGGTEGLFRVDIESKSRKNYTSAKGLISNTVKALAVDRLGFIWLGTDRGVSQFDGKNNWVTYDYSDGLPSNVINSVYVDPLDNIWFGTDKGLALYDRSKFTVRTMQQGLPSNNVTSMTMDANGVFWIGTDAGLLRQEGKKTRIFTTADGLPSDHVLSVAVDGRWNVWVGTLGQGTARFDGSKWVRFSDAQGMPKVTVNVVALDLADNKWFGTEAGVYKFDGRTFTKSTTEIYR
ncbi:MAG: chitobiase/beta-hexosaminidase C-terminal domain-containing protein [bacterium]|nr:chitobiase/beta-hexosaminidase C-terminal domain-containing protein [bacterium]